MQSPAAGKLEHRHPTWTFHLPPLRPQKYPGSWAHLLLLRVRAGSWYTTFKVTVQGLVASLVILTPCSNFATKTRCDGLWT